MISIRGTACRIPLGTERTKIKFHTWAQQMALYLEYGISSIYRAEGISDITRQQTQNQFPTKKGRVVNVSHGVLSLTPHKRI